MKRKPGLNRTLWRSILLFMLASVFTGCQKNVNQNTIAPQIIHQEGVKLTNQKLPELKMMKGEKKYSVNTCNEFLANSKDSNVVETDANFKVYGDYQPCIAANLFSQAKASEKSYYNNDFALLAHENIDLASFRSSLRPAMEDNQHTFKDIKLHYSKADSVVVYNTDEWQYTLTLLAKGDFNQDKVEDLLVGFLDKSKTASYYANVTLVLIKTSDNSLWMADESEKYIK